MKNFSLLNRLNELATSEPVPDKLTTGIQYDEYALTLKNKQDRTVYIPKRISESFEAELNTMGDLTNIKIKGLLRKFNGVTEL